MPADPAAAAYAAMVAQAEASVASVKDPELRRVAFEKILTTLLEQQATPAKATGSRQAKRSAPATAARPVRAAKKRAGGPMAYVQELVGDGFFKKQKTIADVKAELVNRGHHIPLTSLSGPLQRLTKKKQLRRQKVATNGKKSKTTFAYSNW